LDSWKQWLHPSSSCLLESAPSSRHRSYLQWPVWDYPVLQNYYPRSYPLVNVNDNYGQRNVQSNYNCHPIGDYDPAFYPEAWSIDPYQDLHQHVYNQDGVTGLEDSVQSMEGGYSFSKEDFPGEEPVEEIGGLTFSFAENFFANPFSVSFPGDLPGPNAPTSTSIYSESTLSSTHNPGKSRTAGSPKSPPTPSSPTQVDAIRLSTPRSTVHTPSSLNKGAISKSKAPTSTNYASQIQFVDMADKKGAQRIRNTMNSRKHRQNKLDKIRELEKKLAMLEAEKGKWQGKMPGR